MSNLNDEINDISRTRTRRGAASAGPGQEAGSWPWRGARGSLARSIFHDAALRGRGVGDRVGFLDYLADHDRVEGSG